jgi:hypothetical protein
MEQQEDEDGEAAVQSHSTPKQISDGFANYEEELSIQKQRDLV